MSWGLLQFLPHPSTCPPCLRVQGLGVLGTVTAPAWAAPTLPWDGLGRDLVTRQATLVLSYPGALRSSLHTPTSSVSHFYLSA